MSFIPSETVKKLTCKSCNKYLSYFPIYLEQRTSGAICGRCADNLVVDNDYVENTTFQSLVEFQKFPCIFDKEGCVEKLTPCDAPRHEQICPYRVVSCLLDCVWQGTVNELLDHVEELHPMELLPNGEFEIGLISSYEKSYFLTFNDELFALSQNFNISTSTLKCKILCYQTRAIDNKYYYEVSVSSANRNLSKKFPLKLIGTSDENVTIIDIGEIKKMLNDPSIIIGCVKILSDISEEPPVKKVPNPEIFTEMLSELECPVCFYYIIPPIFQCVTGHSICEYCKPKVSECPTCRLEIKDNQNITLEKVAYLLSYPCKFALSGCDFVAKAKQIKNHQIYCLFGPQTCPLKEFENCKWEGASKDVYTHVDRKHSDNILDVERICVFLSAHYFTEEEHQCYIKKFSKYMFVLHYKYSQNRFYWAMQLIGPPEEAKNYKFEIDIIDNNNNNRRLFLKSMCSNLTSKKESFVDPNLYVFVCLEQIRSFITDELSYLVRITN